MPGKKQQQRRDDVRKKSVGRLNAHTQNSGLKRIPNDQQFLK
jgi:hypothetical protein